MLTARLIAKTIGVSIAALVALMVALVGLLAVGVPQAILAPASWVSFAAVGYIKSKELWNSRKPWAWALAGLFLGILAFPFFWFCYEHNRATNEKVEAPREASPAAQSGVAPAPVPILPEGANL
jgi:hypothetical protein